MGDIRSVPGYITGGFGQRDWTLLSDNRSQSGFEPENNELLFVSPTFSLLCMTQKKNKKKPDMEMFCTSAPRLSHATFHPGHLETETVETRRSRRRPKEMRICCWRLLRSTCAKYAWHCQWWANDQTFGYIWIHLDIFEEEPVLKWCWSFKLSSIGIQSEKLPICGVDQILSCYILSRFLSRECSSIKCHIQAIPGMPLGSRLSYTAAAAIRGDPSRCASRWRWRISREAAVTVVPCRPSL